MPKIGNTFILWGCCKPCISVLKLQQMWNSIWRAARVHWLFLRHVAPQILIANAQFKMKRQSPFRIAVRDPHTGVLINAGITSAEYCRIWPRPRLN
jgi:hypothetical protein